MKKTLNVDADLFTQAREACGAAMPRASTISHSEVVTFVRDRGVRGQGVGWV